MGVDVVKLRTGVAYSNLGMLGFDRVIDLAALPSIPQV
jgi:hypothetical protein